MTALHIDNSTVQNSGNYTFGLLLLFCIVRERQIPVVHRNQNQAFCVHCKLCRAKYVHAGRTNSELSYASQLCVYLQMIQTSARSRDCALPHHLVFYSFWIFMHIYMYSYAFYSINNALLYRERRRHSKQSSAVNKQWQNPRRRLKLLINVFLKSSQDTVKKKIITANQKILTLTCWSSFLVESSPESCFTDQEGKKCKNLIKTLGLEPRNLK